jgi:3-oxoacyl-[acyl-carrier protein] reductase
MNDQVAIITGASRGIGRATAVELARAGFRVVLAGRDTRTLDETRKAAGEALVVATDVTKPDEVQRLITVALDNFGRIDALINNAGLAPVLSIPEMTIEQWHAVIDTNLSAAFYATRAAWPVFERQRSGVVVNISSVAARDPFAGFAAYGAAKAGLNLFGLAAAREGARIGIRVHTIAPGATETAMLRQFFPVQQLPAEQTLDPADVARVVLQCIRGDLRYTSGEVIYLQKTL